MLPGQPVLNLPALCSSMANSNWTFPCALTSSFLQKQSGTPSRLAPLKTCWFLEIKVSAARASTRQEWRLQSGTQTSRLRNRCKWRHLYMCIWCLLYSSFPRPNEYIRRGKRGYSRLSLHKDRQQWCTTLVNSSACNSFLWLEHI